MQEGAAGESAHDGWASLAQREGGERSSVIMVSQNVFSVRGDARQTVRVDLRLSQFAKCANRFAQDDTFVCQSESHQMTRSPAYDRYDPFGGVRWDWFGEDDSGMDKTREFWLRLGVIGSALVLMSYCWACVRQ